MNSFLEIVFNIPVKAVYTYKNIDGIENPIGCRVEANFGGRKLIGLVIGVSDSPPSGYQIKDIIRYIDLEPILDLELIDLGKWIADFTMCSIGEALMTMIPGGKKERDLPPDSLGEIPKNKAINLSIEQNKAIETVLNSNEHFFYLYGITGSGKTEVFLNIAEKILEKGKSVIYLVPEISLTHQVIESLRARFSQGIGVLHSHLTPSQKLKEWRRIQHGEAPLIIGARSAIFAPCKNLGLVIIDEEHEGSYKSSNTPRFSARQVAMKRVRNTESKLIMGSATPSVESWKLMEDGGITKLVLGGRLSGGSVPESIIVNMSKEEGVLSRLLIEKIIETQKKGKQTILFLNRRGFSYFYKCNSCNYQMTCKNCSVSLTYHKSRNKMICHYCGYQSPLISVCPECNSLDMISIGFGTEHIEEEIAKLFPDYKIARLDTDTVLDKKTLKTTLDQFKKGEIDILIGTQMVSRGLNFPGVNLVGIIMADTGLNIPDFRAPERTFSLIMQVAGRAGRYSRDGQVIIQTFMPQNRAISLAAKSDVDNFYKDELETRKILEFPPYSRLIRLVFRSKNSMEVVDYAIMFSDLLQPLLPENTEILGPAECPLSVVSGNYRYQLLVKTNNFSIAHSQVYSSLERFKKPSTLYIEVDVDPISLK